MTDPTEARTGPPPKDTAPSEDVPEATDAGAPQEKETGRRRQWVSPLSLPGSWVAVVLAALSFTPSLLPRSGLFQGTVTGVTAAIGYGLGVVGAWVWREFADRDARVPSSRSWRIFAAVAVVGLLASAVLGRLWQSQLRDLMGIEGGEGIGILLMPLVAALVFLLLVAIGRGVRLVARWVANVLDRWMGARAARVLAWAVVTALLVLLLDGVLYERGLQAADATFAAANTITPEGVEQPQSALRSGSPQSLIPWDSLGREGRKFTASGPTTDELARFNEAPAVEPVRIFAGADSADDAEARAQLAVRDLERAGGFDRALLMVATTTGSGWLEPASVDAFEYLTNGDSAIISMQYSYLPSWISYLVDQQRAREAGRELFDAVYERWLALPATDRPKIVIFGESLGSFGAEAAFSGAYDLANRTSGAVFVGAPSFNTLASEFTDERDPGSTELEPVYRDGRIVRFTSEVRGGIPPAGQPWDGSRVVYLQHPSDPIVWWNFDLMLNEPDWLDESRGRDVLDEMVWIPFVTFWQVTADMPQGNVVPPGHGHVYRGDHVDAWAAVLRPANWSPARSDALRVLLAG
jgi:uncharacterized membrane protein